LARCIGLSSPTGLAFVCHGDCGPLFGGRRWPAFVFRSSSCCCAVKKHRGSKSASTPATGPRHRHTRSEISSAKPFAENEIVFAMFPRRSRDRQGSQSRRLNFSIRPATDPSPNDICSAKAGATRIMVWLTPHREDVARALFFTVRLPKSLFEWIEAPLALSHSATITDH